MNRLPLPEQLQLELHGLVVIFGSLLLGLLIKFVLFRILSIHRGETEQVLVRSIKNRLNGPLSFLLPLIVISMTLSMVPVEPEPRALFRRILEVLLIISFTWMLVRVVLIFQDYFRNKYELNQPDNLNVRKLFTQLQYVRRVSIIIIVLFGASLILMSFDSVRKLGTGILTSAGVLGLIIGFAAQRSIANLLAGFQIAFTQPIRLDDVLVVEGEWGRVEEITMTYVVVKLWDQRRLIFPLNYFIEKPFQNWTRNRTDLVGTAFFYVDYTLPVDAVRAELERIVKSTNLWDGQVCVLQVTDLKERVVELRAVVSAVNSGNLFDLRCLVRERLLLFIRQHHPEGLPRTRSEIVGPYPEKNISF